ncbi:oral-facial-digital syndrome 1 protein homolog isoform X3 [Scyliorhinus canicula]|uniref:oral-facial-digital syndrome 1 protein homolog isoform X3 n=1 Tax=Scyliorhinus canicula TaxID=7830 RepID=UPI0018F44567|nr:oral-facial-digital syndrome 1 protein homolog isoform X3 [Scyliorhinus canicula]
MESKMTSGTCEAISSEELRRRLYQTFKNRGVLDSLKSQLRNQLVHELTHPGINGPTFGHRHPSPSTDEDSLLVMAANSIVVDHLHRIGYEYSLSVFYPECGLEKGKVFTARDLLQIMKINPRSDLYKSIISNLQKDHQKGFLIQFLMELTDYHLTRDYRDAQIQTSCVTEYNESIVDKLQMVDEEYAAFHPTNLQDDFWETKLLVYRKQIEEQLQAEMQQELQHFKDLELAKVRIQEKEHSQKNIEEHRSKLDKMYQMKSETLITREKNAIERLQKQQEIEEKEIYMQRQSLLKDIEAVRNREVELRQRIEAFELSQNLHDQRNKSLEQDLRRRELAVKNIEETFEQKLKNELCRYQLELQEEYRKRTEKITINEKRIEAEAARLHEESVIIHSKKEEFQETRVQIKKMEVELDAATAQVCLLMKQNELLNEKLKDTADYTSLKTEHVQHRAEINTLRKQLDEACHENQKLCEMLNQPTAAHLALQAALKKAEYSRKLDQDEYQNHKQILEQQLQNEVERFAKVRSQLLEYEDQTRRLNGQVDDLKLQLRQTQLALENEIYRNPKSSLVDRSSIDLSADRIVPRDIYVEAGLHRSQIAPEDGLFYPGYGICANYGKYTETQTQCSSPDSDQDFVAGAKARIKELEKESENLEEAYRNYQNRIIQAAIQKSSETCAFSPLPINNILSKIPASHQHRVTFADSVFTFQQLERTARRQLYGESHQQITKIEEHQTPSASQFTSPGCCSSTPYKRKFEYDKCRPITEDVDGSFLASVPGLPEHQVSMAINEIQSCDVHAVNTENLPSSVDYGANERSEQPLVDNTGSRQSSTIQRFEEQSDDHCEIVREGIPTLDKNLSQYWEENVNRGSVTSLDQEVNLSPPDTSKFKGPEEEEKNREDEKCKGGEEKTCEDQRQRDEEKRCLERQEEREREQRDLECREQEKTGMFSSMQEKLKTEPNGQRPKEQILEGVELPASTTDPLEKYMKIIQQQKDEKQEQSCEKDVTEESSLLQTLSDGKIGSPTASHEETDDNFW